MAGSGIRGTGTASRGSTATSQGSPVSDRARIDYDFAILRVVPRVHLGTFANVGVVMHARTEEFLALRTITDVSTLAKLAPGIDPELLARYLRSCAAICAGD